MIDILKTVKHNKAIVLGVIASIGVCITAVVSARAAPKAVALVKKAEKKKGTEIANKEKVLAAAPAFILPVAIGVSTIACIMINTITSQRKQAVMASAFGLVSTTYSEYRNKVKELYGEETDRKVAESIAVEKVKNTHIVAQGGIFSSSTLDPKLDEEVRLFLDSYSGRYFESTMSNVINAQYHLNRNMSIGYGFVPLSMWYEFIGLEPTEFSDEIGWMINDCYLWIDFDNRKLELADNLECIAIDFVFEPQTMKYIEDHYC